MARPKLHAAVIQTRRVTLRLTEADYIKLDRAAKSYGLSVSEFVRRRIQSHRLPPQTTEQEAFSKATNALLRLGVNLNQITHRLNRSDRLNLDALYGLIDRINITMEALDESYRN